MEKYIYILFVVATAICSSCVGGTSSSIPSSNEIELNALNGKAINTIGLEPAEYLKLVDNPNTTNNEIAQYLYTTRSHQWYSAGDIRISWKSNSTWNLPFQIDLYSDENCTKLVKSYKTYETNYSLKNLIPNKYYYKVSDSSSTPFVSKVDSFSFDSFLRTIYAGGSGRYINNMRDLGGWTTKDGKKVKYGKVFRSASWANAGIDTEKYLAELGMKTELDVRLGSDYSSSQHPVSGINFIQNGFTDAYPYMFSDSSTLLNMNRLVNDILVRKENYPLTYHCSVGADRTGLTSLLIESILNFSDEDIYRDYELTTFYQSDRVRADILKNDGVYSFDPSGKRKDFWSVDGTGSGFMYLFVDVLQPYFTESGTISDAVVNFLKTKCSVTDASINTIRSYLLEN